MNLHLFGASTSTGESLRQQFDTACVGSSLFSYSRNNTGFLHADFRDPSSFVACGEQGDPGLWLSFGPIWLFAPFLERLACFHPDRLQGLCGVIACSSSSVITKRFAANKFDRELVANLIKSEDQLISTCARLGIPCHILRPTLIYGKVGRFEDKNLSFLTQLMRVLPFLPVPKGTGLRQPIHASQLAAVVLEIAMHFTETTHDIDFPQFVTLGGDSELSYEAMLRAYQKVLPDDDPARRCFFLPIPIRIYFLAAAPLLFFSPKYFEAILRMGSNLSGFTPVHKLLDIQPEPFPVVLRPVSKCS